MGSPPPKRVLLITNSEHGQANVFLATSYALLTLPDEDVHVHFASFPSIQKSVLATSDHALRDNPHARPLVFHEISGVSMVDAWSRPEVASERQRLAIVDVVSLFYAIRRMMVLLKVMLPWTGPEFVEIMKSVMDIVDDVQPDVIAVDPAFSPALTALRYTGAKFMVLSPNTIKDFVMPLQPNGEALWKYPCIGAPFPFPVPRHQIPSNILLVLIALLTAAFFDSHRRAVQSHVSHRLPGAQLTTLNDLSLKHLGLRFLVANLPEIEFPLSAPIPPSITRGGPILRPTPPLSSTSPPLSTFLHTAPTVYINLGTHLTFTEPAAFELATALRILFDACTTITKPNLQALWKLPRHPNFDPARIHALLAPELDAGRVRIVEWLDAEPTAILTAGGPGVGVVCAVHHGGANSFLEGVSAGIPHVILPVWMDTYDFARRAEVLGIGRWGNVGAAGEEGVVCRGRELGGVLVDVVVDNHPKYAARARELAGLCERDGGGRVIAARRILEEIGISREGGKGGEDDNTNDE
ncbi:hypothetical protein QBC39DRAFT_295915 [Podospora conica]|nr:hypothetical protein QBC39DRAFT_295915 [Schizothecium conicum]